MGNFVASDVTYTVKNLRRMGNSRVQNRIQLTFGDSSLTYPAGGIPITKGKLGCPNVVESAIIVEQGTSGYKFQYDTTNNKLIMMQSPVRTHTHDLLVKNASIADAAGTRVNVAANVFGANSAGGDITVTGGGANGGVVSTTLAAAALSEASTVAIAAQTIILEVIGW